MNELNIHIRLKEARTFLNLNQLLIAADLNIQQKTVSEIENGRILNIPNRYIYYFYEKGISINWLYDGTGSMTNDVYTAKHPDEEKDDTTNLQSDLINPEKDLEFKAAEKSEYIHSETIKDVYEVNISSLINAKDVNIKTLLSYVNSQERMIEFLQKIIKKEMNLVQI